MKIFQNLIFLCILILFSNAAKLRQNPCSTDHPNAGGYCPSKTRYHYNPQTGKCYSFPHRGCFNDKPEYGVYPSMSACQSACM